MYPLGFNDFSDSPVIILSPHQHQFDPISQAAHSLYRPSTKPVMDSRPYDIPLTSNHAKKRSRDELSTAEANVTGVQIPPTATPMVSPEPASGIPMHSPTIPLFPLNQDSQPAAGSYIHEPILTTDYSNVDIPSSASRSPEDMPRRKVSRRDSTAHDDEHQGGSDSSSSPPAAGGGPKIDEWTRRLGISWTGPEDNPIAIACLRGYQTFIEKHYPLTNAKIVAQNKQHCCCLVEASQGWYLFDDDLRNGKLLSRAKERALNNLTQNPVVFEEPEAMEPRWQDTSDASSTERVSQDSQDGMVVGRMDLD